MDPTPAAAEPLDVAAALADALAAADRMTSSAGRRHLREDARDGAAAGVERAARKYDPAAGDWLPFARATVRREVLSRLRRAATARQDNRFGTARPPKPRRAAVAAADLTAVPDADGVANEPISSGLLAGLTEAEDDVVRLRFESGLSFAAIGRLRGRSRQAVAATFAAAVAKLRARLPSRG